MGLNFYTNVVSHKGNLLYIGYQDGKKIKYKTKLKPVLYNISEVETKYKSLYGHYLTPITFDNVYNANEFIKYSNGNYFGYEKYHYVWLTNIYKDEIDIDINLIKILYYDIETTVEYGFPDVYKPVESIISITLYDTKNKSYKTLGVGDSKGDIGCEYLEFEDERALLEYFVNYWRKLSPDIYTAWNGSLFDTPYLCARIQKLFGDSFLNKLSPWDIVDFDDSWDSTLNKRVKKVVIYGVTELDYLSLYKKFTYINRESYKLDFIAQEELGEQKLDHSFYKTFKDFYTIDFNLFLKYNLQDVKLLLKLEDKLKLLELAIYLSYDAKINYFDVFSPTVMWDNIIYNYLSVRNIVIPPKKDNSNLATLFDGAYVKQPVPKLYKYVVSCDLASLYPHIIQCLNISPETLIDDVFIKEATVDNILNKSVNFDEYKDYCIAPGGYVFNRNMDGVLPILMHDRYRQRKEYKNKQIETDKQLQLDPDNQKLKYDIAKYKAIQLAKKYSMNAGYGATGCVYFRYFNVKIAGSITGLGQVAIRFVSNRVNDYLNDYLKTTNFDYIITNDTDSLFLNLESLVNKYLTDLSDDNVVSFLNNFTEEYILPFIKKTYDELSDYLHFKRNVLTMNRDVIAKSMLSKAKKHYVLYLLDKEGVRYHTPKLSFTGVEVVSSRTPRYFREKMKDAFKIIMTGTNPELWEFFNNVIDSLSEIPIEDISFNSSVNNIGNYYVNGEIISGTPYHVRASIIYNNFVVDNGYVYKYPLIKNGDKIKLIYLKRPNKFNNDVISYIDEPNEDMNLRPIIDYNTQFVKAFKNPLEGVLDVINWTFEPLNTLDNLFL